MSSTTTTSRPATAASDAIALLREGHEDAEQERTHHHPDDAQYLGVEEEGEFPAGERAGAESRAERTDDEATLLRQLAPLADAFTAWVDGLTTEAASA